MYSRLALVRLRVPRVPTNTLRKFPPPKQCRLITSVASGSDTIVVSPPSKTFVPPSDPPPPPRLITFAKIGLGLISTAAVSMVGLLGFQIYAWRTNSEDKMENETMNLLFEGQTFPEEEDLVDLPELRQRLEKVFQPTRKSRTYFLIVGEHGTGKSTAVMQAIKSLSKPKGVVYFCAVQDKDFLLLFAKTLGFSLDVVTLRTFQFWEKNESLAWTHIEQYLKKIAEKFFEKHKRPMCIVIDGAEIVAKKDEELLFAIQRFAKFMADSGKLRFVFVSGDGTVLEKLNSQSAESRMGVMIEVGDIPDDKAVEYLVKEGFDKTDAESIVTTFTGGRFGLLSKIVGKEEPFERTREIRLGKLKDTMNDLEKLHDTEMNEMIAAFFPRLLKEKKIIRDDPLVKAMEAKGVMARLLGANIVAYHTDRTYTFHARYVEPYFRNEQNSIA